jgi:flagellar hook-associated protein 3 FlgL
MTIDRVATNSQSQFLLQQIMQTNAALNTSQTQVTTGMVSTDYTGIGDKTAALEAARAAADRANAYQSSTQLALTQTDLQNTQLSELSSLAQQLQQAVMSAAGNADGTNLMQTAQSIFQQASSILNAQDSNGNYIYGGQNTDAPPFTATSLADLGTAPISTFFANGDIKKTVQVGDGQTQQIGVLASDIGTQLMTALNTLNQANTASPFNGQLTQAQADTLTSTVLPEAKTAATGLNDITGANGTVYKNLQDAVTNQQSLSTLYTGFVSDIQDVDMATAVTKLNQNQVALQAALSVTAHLGQISLLNYLPTLTATG